MWKHVVEWKSEEEDDHGNKPLFTTNWIASHKYFFAGVC